MRIITRRDKVRIITRRRDKVRIITEEDMIVRLSLLRKTILIPEYLAFMCVCVFVDGCISQF